jgi:hypothetical protein
MPGEVQYVPEPESKFVGGGFVDTVQNGTIFNAVNAFQGSENAEKIAHQMLNEQQEACHLIEGTILGYTDHHQQQSLEEDHLLLKARGFHKTLELRPPEYSDHHNERMQWESDHIEAKGLHPDHENNYPDFSHHHHKRIEQEHHDLIKSTLPDQYFHGKNVTHHAIVGELREAARREGVERGKEEFLNKEVRVAGEEDEEEEDEQLKIERARKSGGYYGNGNGTLNFKMSEAIQNTVYSVHLEISTLICGIRCISVFDMSFSWTTYFESFRLFCATR